jgi:hypothetical protein
VRTAALARHQRRLQLPGPRLLQRHLRKGTPCCAQRPLSFCFTAKLTPSHPFAPLQTAPG